MGLAENLSVINLRNSEIISELALIVRKGEYLSHLSALYLAGFTREFPAQFTIVSAARRRNRLIAGVPLVFVTHERLQSVVRMIRHERSEIACADASTAFVDLLLDMKYAPELENLADLAVCLPLSASEVLRQAALISDTVLKRASYLLAWAGRLTFARIPFRQFRTSPVLLDARVSEKSALLWDKRFRLYVPSQFPGRQRKKPVSRFSNAFKDWHKLSSIGIFSKIEQGCGCILLRADPHLPQLPNRLELPKRMPEPSSILGWLEDAGLYPLPVMTKNRLRRMFADFLRQAFVVDPVDFFAAIENDSAFQMALPPEAVDCLFQLGIVLALPDLLQNLFARRGEDLLDRTGAPGMLVAARFLAGSGRKLKNTVTGLIARVLAAAGHRHSAAKVLRKSDKKVTSGRKWLVLAEACVFKGSDRRIRRLKKILESEKNSDDILFFVRAEACIGQYFINSGRFRQAIKHFKKATRCLKNLPRQILGLRGILIGKIGLALSYLSNAQQSEPILSHAVRVSGRIRAYDATAVFMLARSRYLDKTGVGESAIAMMKIALRYFSRFRMTRECGETAALLALANDVMGFKTASEHWLESARVFAGEDNACSSFASGNAAMLANQPAQAVEHYVEAIEKSREVSSGVRLNALLNCQIARSATGSRPGAVEADLIRRFVRSGWKSEEVLLLKALGFETEPTESICSELVVLGFFTPFWYYFSEKFVSDGDQDKMKFIKMQYEKSSARIKERAQSWFKVTKAERSLELVSSDRQFGRLCLLNAGGMTIVDKRNIRKIMKETDKAELIFDFAAGKMSFAATTADIRPDALHVRLLEYLLQVWPETATADKISETIWKTSYDHEIDFFVIKTTAFRLRKLLSSICPVAVLSFKYGSRKMPALSLSLPENWQAWLRI